MTSRAVTTLFCSLFALGLGCTKQTSGSDQGVAPPQPAPPPAGDVTIELAGITLGDDCGGGWTPPPPATATTPPASTATVSVAPATPAVVSPSRGPAAPSKCAAGADCGGYTRACQQTSVQLAMQAKGGTTPTTIRIKKVELLDASGKLLAELASSAPTRWTDAGSYQPWDQTIAPGAQLAVSYILASPAWGSMEGGMYGQANKTFQVRVTVLVGTKDRVIEKKAIQPTIMPPAVPT